MLFAPPIGAHNQELNLKVLILLPNIVKCYKTMRAESAAMPKIAGEIRNCRYWPVWSWDIEEMEWRMEYHPDTVMFESIVHGWASLDAPLN